MSDKPWVNIESESGMGHTSRVTTQDGVEIKYVTGVDVAIRVGEPNRATIHVLKVGGKINAEVEAIKETLVPDPSAVLVLKVGAPSDASAEDDWIPKSPITITRHSNRGTDHTLVETVCEGWVSACDPFELTIPEEER